MNSSTTVLDWLNKASAELKHSGVETYRLDALILLEDRLKLNRANLLAHPDLKLSFKNLDALNIQLAQRVTNMPLAYIRHKIEFYGRSFTINDSVLVPRPQSETMIQELLLLKLQLRPIVADVGCGSGVLGISAALCLPDAKICLYDVSSSALEVAKQNIKKYRLGKSVMIAKSDLLSKVKPLPDVILANLPYVPLNYSVSKSVAFEPKIAVFSGSDGMTLYKDFWHQVKHLSHLTEYILTESLAIQHQVMESLAKHSGFKLITTNDLTQVFQKT